MPEPIVVVVAVTAAVLLALVVMLLASGPIVSGRVISVDRDGRVTE